MNCWPCVERLNPAFSYRKLLFYRCPAAVSEGVEFGDVFAISADGKVEWFSLKGRKCPMEEPKEAKSTRRAG